MLQISNVFVKPLAVSGSAGRDVIIKLRSLVELGEPFTRYARKTLPYSKIPEYYGCEWSIDSVMSFLRRQALAPTRCSYGGRAPHVAYGVAKLGGDVRLVTVFGSDFDEPYPGFFDGGYWSHLLKAGVKMSSLEVTIPDEVWRSSKKLREYLEAHPEIRKREVLLVSSKLTPTIVCCGDLHGNDWFYIDDLRGAGHVDVARPVPTDVLKEVDIVFVTTSEPPFMREMILKSSSLGKEVLFDVGSYGVTPEFLRDVVPRCKVVLGNQLEIGQVCNAYGVKGVEGIFDATESKFPEVIVMENKLEGAISVITRRKRFSVGPVKLEKTGSSVGCCDGMAAGFLFFYQHGFDLRSCARAALVFCASIWRVEGVQEGMPDSFQFYDEYESTFQGECTESELEAVRQALKLEQG